MSLKQYIDCYSLNVWADRPTKIGQSCLHVFLIWFSKELSRQIEQMQTKLKNHNVLLTDPWNQKHTVFFNKEQHNHWSYFVYSWKEMYIGAGHDECKWLISQYL